MRNLVSEFYLELGRSKRDLEETYAIVKLWRVVISKTLLVDKLAPLEDLILESAKYEWGPETIVEFDREDKTATVINFKKNLSTKL